MCSTWQSGRLQLLLRQSQALPMNRLLSCFPVSTATAAAARLNIHHVSHHASGSSPIPALRRRHVLLAPSAVVPAAAAATTAINPWQTLAVLCTCAAAAQAAEGHTAWGRLLSAPLLTLLLALGAATLGLLPATSAVYDVVWSHLMPLAIALFLLDHDVSNIRQAGGPVLASFLLGAGTMIAGAAAAWLLCKSAMAAAAGSTAAAAKLAACLVASYIGGSVNFIAVAAATQLPTSLVPGAMAADNLGMLLLLGLLMAVPLRLLQQQQQPQLQLALADVPFAPPTSSSSGSGGGGSGMWPQQQRRRGTPMAGGRPGSSRSTYTVAASATAAGASPGGPSGDTTSSSSGGGSSSGEDEWVALDGSPLLTQPPTPLEVSTALDEISQGENHTRVLPVNLSGKRSSGSSSGSSSSSRPGVALSDGMIALDGTPLLTQPPSESDVELALDEIRHGENHARVLPVLPKVGDGTTTSSSSSSGGGGGGVEPVAAAPMGPKCGGCPGSGVTANDDNPLLTRVPSMGDGVSSIIAAKEGKQQLRTPPKPPSPTFNKSGRTATTAAGGSNGNRGYNSQREPDGRIIGCGGCSEALDFIAAKSPLPAAIAAGGWGGSHAAAAGSSGSSSVLALDGSPLLTQPPSQSEVSACIEETSHGENHTRVLPVLLKANDSSSSSSSSSSTSSSGSGALALDGGMLLTEEPDFATVAAAVEAARQGGSNGSSVAVSPLVSGEFELLVKLDKDSLMQRLRHQQRKYKKQQQKQQLGSTAAAAASSSSCDSGSDSSSSSSDDDDLLANDGSPLLTQPPSGFEVAACLKETSNGNNQTRMLPVLPRLNNSSDSGSSSGSGALALDGSMLLTDEPDSARLAAAVVAACKGSSSGSSVAVSPVVSSDFESLVRLDKETLMKRLRHQQRKVKKQQQEQHLGTASAAVGSSYDSSSSSSGSDDEDLCALDGSLLLTQPPSQIEVAMCVEGASQGDNQTRVLPVLPKASSSSSSSRSKGNDDDRDDNGGSSGGSSAGTSTAHKAGPTTATAASGSVQTSSSSSSSSSSSDGVLTASAAAAAVAAAAVAAAVSHELATVFSTPALHQLVLAATAVGISAAATAVSKMQQPSAAAAAGTAGGPGPFSGASQLGQVLIGVFFAALGASCCCPLSTLACCLPLLSFITVMTATHWVLLWVVGGRVLGLQPEVLLCGSAAAIGGPATAAGLASAKGWGHLVQPSLLCGSLGYALGTGAGLAVAQGIGALA